MDTDRRTTLAGFGAALMLAASSPAQAESSDPKGPPGAALAELSELLRKAPRLRDFKSVPMILENPDFWDSELLIEVLNWGLQAGLGQHADCRVVAQRHAQFSQLPGFLLPASGFPRCVGDPRSRASCAL